MFHFLQRLGLQHSLENDIFDPMQFEGEAVIEEVVVPGKKWRIYFRGTWWNAISTQSIACNPQETVYVVGRTGITLIVAPMVAPVA